MKLSEHIKEDYAGNVNAYAEANNYHVTQVKRSLIKGAEIDDKGVFVKLYMKQKQTKLTGE
jgi:hypothetical protein